LLGQHQTGGRAAYYPLLLAIKTPIGTLGLWLAAILAMLVVRRHEYVTLWLLPVPRMGLAFAVQSDTNIGYRHILMVAIFLNVLSGVLVAGNVGVCGS
jgi:hypothetical protein